MSIDAKLNRLKNEFYSELVRIQDSRSKEFYGYPPGWDAIKKVAIAGKKPDLENIEKMCNLRGL